MTVRDGGSGRGPVAYLDDLAIYAGVVATVVAFGMIFLTTTMAPWFSWPGDALSDLGHPDRWELYWIYNYGLMVAGTLGVVFAVRSALDRGTLAHVAGSLVMAVSLADLALVGYYHAGRDPHVLVSTLFFVTLTYGVFLYGSGEVLAGNVYRGLGTIWLGLVHAAWWGVWGLVDLGDGVAIPEFVGALVVAGWTAVAIERMTGFGIPGLPDRSRE